MIEPVTLSNTTKHVLHSGAAHDRFELWVGRPTPRMFSPSTEKPRVLYVLDADLWFGVALEMTRLMHALFGELPPYLVVGIAYGEPDWAKQSALRTRDFTPTTHPKLGPAASGPLAQTPMGRSSTFLEFLKHEAVPFIDARYDTEGAPRTLFGSSLGGLFTLWAYLTAPSAFSSFIAASPAIWWDDDMLFALAARADPSRSNAYLHLCVGGLEEDPRLPMLAPFKMVTHAQKMRETLLGAEGARPRVACDVIAEETHTSVLPIALTRGLRALARPPLD